MGDMNKSCTNCKFNVKEEPKEKPKEVKTEPISSKTSDKQPFIDILDQKVGFEVANDIVYLEKRILFNQLDLDKVPKRSFDRCLEEASLCLDEVYLYQGRIRGFVSTGALKIFVQKLTNLSVEDKQSILARLEEIESQKEALKSSWILTLDEFGPVGFKVKGTIIYLNTVQMLNSVGFSAEYLEKSKSKMFYILCRLLTMRGYNLENSFLKAGKSSKYLYISIYALFRLFETSFGSFKNKERLAVLKDSLLKALEERGYGEMFARGAEEESTVNDDKHIFISPKYPPIKFKVIKNLL